VAVCEDWKEEEELLEGVGGIESNFLPLVAFLEKLIKLSLPLKLPLRRVDSLMAENCWGTGSATFWLGWFR